MFRRLKSRNNICARVQRQPHSWRPATRPVSLVLLMETVQVIFEDSNSASTSCFHPVSSCRSIPQVFSRWYDVYTNSLLLWKDVNIDFEAILLPRSFRQRQLAAESIFSWLYRRRHAIQRLTLSGCYLVDDILDGNLYHLTRNAPRLASITLNSCANSRGTTLSFLQAPTLKSVTLTHHQPKSGMYRTMAVDTRSLMSLPCTLPLLQHLNLTLDVFAGSPADLGIISEMPFLTSLKLASRSESMLLLPEVLAGFGRLQRLELENVRYVPPCCIF